MKLIYIVNARIPTEKAHGIQIMKMCEAFTMQGIDVTLVVPRRKKIIKTDPFLYYSIKEKFRIVYLPVIEIYGWGYLGFIIGSLSFAISSLFYGLHNRGKAVFYSRDQDQFSFFPFFLGLNPYFFEVHGLKKPDFLHNYLFKKVKGVIATNSFIRGKLIENFPLLKDKVILQPNGVEISMFTTVDKKQARNKLSLPLDKKIVLYAGHLYAWKGVNTLIEASQDLPSGVELYLVGGNEEDIERIKGEVVGNTDSIHYIGRRPYFEIPIWYSAADILVITGTAKNADSVHFTSPIKLFEYMATRRPIVAVDSPAVRDIVSSDEVYFYKPDDKESLREVIISTLRDEIKSVDKSNKAYTKAESYTWSNRAKSIIDFISVNK